MITWFDRLRAEGQGRTVPKSFTAPDGQHVFVLGGDGALEEAILQGGDPGSGGGPVMPGDQTEIKQIVDLANWDLVSATFDTVGVLMGQAQPEPGFPDPPSGLNELWHFNYDIGLPTARNLVAGRFDLLDAGDIEVGNESYSPALTRCRIIPVGSATAQLNGANTPQWMTTFPLDQYTVQYWLNFDAVAHASSWGINPNIFYCRDGVPNGFECGLSGTFGPGHQWSVNVTHHFGGSSSTTFNGFVFDTPNPGWTLLTITWDRLTVPAQRNKLYINDNPVPYLPFAPLGNSPVPPAVATPIIVADPLLWGGLDEMRMVDGELTPAQIAASYLACTSWPTPINYEWLMQIVINEEVYAERVIQPDERRRWTDFQVPVRHLTGPSEVGFRLVLQEV